MLENKPVFTLINEQKASIEEVTNNLLAQKFGTDWAEITNQLAINYAIHLNDVYGNNWCKGFLPEEFFLNIFLPSHHHSITDKDNIFPIDTQVKDVDQFFKKSKSQHTEECLKLIDYLKKEIKQNGFTSSIVLVVIHGELKHVDGLHRMIALASLITEGYEYKPIPVLLCDSTKSSN